MNGALYLSEMDMSGGMNEYNPGAAYGGGYCDAQCFNTSSWYADRFTNRNIIEKSEF